ncbi:MAG: hypothetical protein OXC46_09000 [Thaumarchaeota archaeon]|nr:hypothetical protein [Nitrososphaerota archaeon]
MMYTISVKNNSKIVTILDVLTHKEYEKRASVHVPNYLAHGEIMHVGFVFAGVWM